MLEEVAPPLKPTRTPPDFNLVTYLNPDPVFKTSQFVTETWLEKHWIRLYVIFARPRGPNSYLLGFGDYTRTLWQTSHFEGTREGLLDFCTGVIRIMLFGRPALTPPSPGPGVLPQERA